MQFHYCSIFNTSDTIKITQYTNHIYLSILMYIASQNGAPYTAILILFQYLFYSLLLHFSYVHVDTGKGVASISLYMCIITIKGILFYSEESVFKVKLHF